MSTDIVLILKMKQQQHVKLIHILEKIKVKLIKKNQNYWKLVRLKQNLIQLIAYTDHYQKSWFHHLKSPNLDGTKDPQ